MKKYIAILLLAVLFLTSCSKNYVELTLGNVTIDIPDTFKPNFIELPKNVLNVMQFYESYGEENTEALFSVLRSRYKKSYRKTVTIDSVVDGMIKDLEKSKTTKNFKLISKKQITIGDIEGYIVETEFYYGPNKTKGKFLALLGEDLIQIMSIYNSSSKSAEKTINKIIKSARISDEI